MESANSGFSKDGNSYETSGVEFISGSPGEIMILASGVELKFRRHTAGSWLEDIKFSPAETRITPR